MSSTSGTGAGAPRPPAGVLFDFHDTLGCLAPSTDEAMGAVVGLSAEAFRGAWAEVERRVQNEREGSVWPPPGEDRWHTLYTLFVDVLGLGRDPRELAAEYERLFTSAESYTAFPDAVAALEAIRAAGIRVGVLSNSDFDLWPVLRRTGLEPHVEVAIPVLLHGTQKPEPSAFRLGLSALGLEPEECWFVGDHLQDDVTASTSLGMSAVLVDRYGRYPAPDVAFPVLADLAPLPGMLGLG